MTPTEDAGAHHMPEVTTKDWKAIIISMTEGAIARDLRIDASFFPPVSTEQLSLWEGKHRLSLPDRIRSFLTISNGLEAHEGRIWPVLPIEDWIVFHDECVGKHPWLVFAETDEYRYLQATGDSEAIYRCSRFGSDEEFFAATFEKYLEQVFRGRLE